MSLIVQLERETRPEEQIGSVRIDPGSRRAPDKRVCTVTIVKTYLKTGRIVKVEVELNTMEAMTIANGLKAATR